MAKKSTKKLLEEVGVELALFSIHPALGAMPGTRKLAKKAVRKASKKVKEGG